MAIHDLAAVTPGIEREQIVEVGPSEGHRCGAPAVIQVGLHDAIGTLLHETDHLCQRLSGGQRQIARKQKSGIQRGNSGESGPKPHRDGTSAMPRPAWIEYIAGSRRGGSGGKRAGTRAQHPQNRRSSGGKDEAREVVDQTLITE